MTRETKSSKQEAEIMKKIIITLIIALCLFVIVLPAIAANGGHGVAMRSSGNRCFPF
jgi:hypothetical protein